MKTSHFARWYFIQYMDVAFAREEKYLYVSVKFSVFWQNFMCAGGMTVFVTVTFPQYRYIN